MEYWKDGKKIEMHAIYGKGVVGQIVVLTHVSYGENPDLEKNPLASYPQPQLFTITGKTEGKEGFYIIKDIHGNEIQVHNELYGASSGDLYDAQEWLMWKQARDAEKFAWSRQVLAQTGLQLNLLKDILVKQGVRMISVDEAKQLDIKDRSAFSGKSGSGTTKYMNAAFLEN